MTLHQEQMGIKEAKVLRYAEGKYVPATVGIIRECPLKVIVNGDPLATIACLGLHTDELAIGFLCSEGLLTSREDLNGLEISAGGLTVRVTTTASPGPRPERGFSVASSGARGREAELPPVTVKTAMDGIGYSPETIFRLMDDMVDKARHHATTRGTHCAALADENGLLALREDIGRHNCLDMLVGYCFLNGLDASGKILLRTGRVSSEIVRKVWQLGTNRVASLSVPTSTAMALAEKSGIMLIGAIRNNQMTIYTKKDQIGVL
jgi:FdhD protein